jgi:DNA-binding MarR family transcriptional regulator
MVALDFMRSLWRVNHALERMSMRMEETLGVTAQQRMMLRWVGKRPGITAGQLAERLHVDAGTVSAAAGRLEKKGLLQRRRDPRDRRRVVLALTPRGQSLDRPTAGTVESAVQRLLRRAPPRDIGGAARVLAALSDSLDEEAANSRRQARMRKRRRS